MRLGVVTLLAFFTIILHNKGALLFTALENVIVVSVLMFFMLFFTIFVRSFVFVGGKVGGEFNNDGHSLEQDTMMTIYAYGGSSQTSNHEFRQLTIPPTTTGFHMKKQLLRNQMDTNYVLLYNNRRIDGDLPIYRQIPNFASVTLCALGKGGGNEDKDIVSDECISCGEDADMFCNTCQSSRCNTCNDLWHSHRLRRDHVITAINKLLSKNLCEDDDSSTDGIQSQGNMSEVIDQCPSSYYESESFQEATLIATLAKTFGLTKFKPFQKDIILSVLDGKDTVVIQPTGSGKSLCYQFPAIYQGKKVIVVSPTISLMQDQVTNLKLKNVNAVFLGSAQLDKKAEVNAFLPHGEINVIFVTPEWIAVEKNHSKVQQLVEADELSLIAIDEAHLFHQWQEFRHAYKDLEKLKVDFPNTPLMVLTATASDVVETSILRLVRSPTISKGSVNRPNVFFQCQELCDDVDFTIFAKKVSETINDESCIIYTDFINSIGPIMSKLQENGIDSLPYYGEMDAKTRYANYMKWKKDEVKVIVATSAFGMGIDKANIRHVIRYGVPESLTSWAQELGRAGRDGHPAKATIYYSMNNTNHAMAWTRDHVGNAEYCKQLLEGFANSWKYVMADLAGKCRREILLNAFGEECFDATTVVDCCDVCKMSVQFVDMREELKIVVDAITVVGCKGELKIVQWIRGSSLQWTAEYNKKSLSYGNFKGKSELWWRKFIRQCHVTGYIQKELKCIIKKSSHYAIQGVLNVLPKAHKVLEGDNPIVLMNEGSTSAKPSLSVGSCSHNIIQTTVHQPSISDRKGKGTHGLIIVKNLLSDKENWIVTEDQSDWQFPGSSCKGKDQFVLFIEDFQKVYANCPKNVHFLWTDIQLSKGKVNNYKTKMQIDGKDVSVVYRSAPCNGVKACPEDGCPYVAPIREQRPCKNHSSKPLYKTNDIEPCPVQFAYIYPDNSNDRRRWILAFVRQPKGPKESLHNHDVHSSSHLLAKTQEDISEAAVANISLKPSEVCRGKGLGYIPAAVDRASASIERISSVMSKARSSSALCNNKWDIASFEKMADCIDENDASHGSNYSQPMRNEIKMLSRPYLISAGIESGIQYIFTMNPLMSEILSKAEFIETDITYNETKEYPYLFNAATFNEMTMDWVVVSRVRLTKQDHQAYCLAFRKTFDKCRLDNCLFKPGESLLAVVTDWSDAEIHGLCDAVGEDVGQSLIRGCLVHWNRSWQRIREKVASSKDKILEKSIFSKIASQISKLPMGEAVCDCFNVLCSQQSAEELLGVIKGLTPDEAAFVNKHCNWSKAKKWVEWWLRPKHLKMLHKDFACMDSSVWDRSPSTTNAVERLNAQCKGKVPVALQTAIADVYKLDKSVCAKHLAARNECSVSYRDKSENARRANAAKRQQQRLGGSIPADLTATHGPPDRACHFNTIEKSVSSTIKRRTTGGDELQLQVSTISKQPRKRDCGTSSKVQSNDSILNDVSNIESASEQKRMCDPGVSTASGLVTIESSSDGASKPQRKRTSTNSSNPMCDNDIMDKEGVIDDDFAVATTVKKQRKSDSARLLYTAPKPSLLGKKLVMKFMVDRKPKWFKGIINAYDGLTGKYGVYFPFDKETVYIFENDKDVRFVDW